MRGIYSQLFAKLSIPANDDLPLYRLLFVSNHARASPCGPPCGGRHHVKCFFSDASFETMSRYKGKASAKAVDRDALYFVDIVVPPDGLGAKLDAMYEFHSSTACAATRDVCFVPIADSPHGIYSITSSAATRGPGEWRCPTASLFSR